MAGSTVGAIARRIGQAARGAEATGLLLGTDRVLELVDRMTGWPHIAMRLPSAAGLAFSAFVLWSASSAIGGT